MGYLGIQIGEKTVRNKHGQGRNTGQSAVLCSKFKHGQERNTGHSACPGSSPVRVYFALFFLPMDSYQLARIHTLFFLTDEVSKIFNAKKGSLL